MDLRVITPQQRLQYNSKVTHIIQSWEWGEFRQKLGLPVLRYGLFDKDKLVVAFQLTLHQIPFTNQYVGYLPKGPLPDKELAQALYCIGQKHHCAFIKLEPDVEMDNGQWVMDNSDLLGLIRSPKPLFAKHSFILDLTKSEKNLLKNTHPKTRYNIRLAQKKGVKIEERTDDQAFEIYLKLYFETTKRQGYHGHSQNYHRHAWEVLKKARLARLLIGFYQHKPLSAWMLVNFKDTLYYPYGGSSIEHREVMANNLLAWEAIKLGKKLKLKKFDMWGALGPDADSQDPWFGFHRFKQGYGGKLVKYLGTYDLVFNWPLYWLFTAVDRLTPLKIFLLKLIGK